MSGWIKLHRALKDWEYYEDHNATRLLIHLLVSVNYEDKKWKDTTIKAGTLVTSWQNLAHETGLTLKQIRLAMTKLERAGETVRNVAGKGAGKWQVVTLVKWDKLQGSDDEGGQIKGQEKGRTREGKRTPTKEVKNKEIKKEEINTNPTNVELVLEPKLNFQDFNDSILAEKLWSQWVKYKRTQHKEKYKELETEQTAINALNKICGGNSQLAQEIIEQSISSLWKGLFKLKSTQSNNNQINPQNGAPKQQPHAFIRKTLRNLERLGTFNTRQVEIAEYYLEHATGPINSEEFFGKLEQLDWSSPAFYPENIGNTLRLGKRQDNRPTFELDN
jgi:hypothetical protein